MTQSNVLEDLNIPKYLYKYFEAQKKSFAGGNVIYFLQAVFSDTQKLLSSWRVCVFHEVAVEIICI
jgi:hypothetical protein